MKIPFVSSSLASLLALRQRLAKILLQPGPHTKKSNILCGLNPTLQLCRLVGFFPVTIAKKKIGFSWLSLPLLWHLTCFSLCVYFSLLDFTLLTARGIVFTPTDEADFHLLYNETEPSDGPLAPGDDNENGDEVCLMCILEYFFPMYFGILVATVLRTCLDIVFILLFLAGLSSARGAPKYFNQLEECFNSICTDSSRRLRVVTKIRSGSVRFILFYVVLMLINFTNRAWLILRVTVPKNTHAFVYAGSMLFQLWYCSHILLSLLTLAIVLTLTLLYEEMNDQLKQLLASTESREISKPVVNPEMNNNSKGDGFKGEKFCPEFTRLKLGYFALEELLHKRNFLFSGFVQIEMIMAVIHLTALITVILDPGLILDWFHLFEIVYHSGFAIKIIFDASRLTEEAKQTEIILSKASLENIPSQAHTEVDIFACKVLTSDEPAIRCFGLRLNFDILDKVKLVVAYVVLVCLLLGYAYLAALVIPRWLHLGNAGDGRMVNNRTVDEVAIPGVSDFHKMKRSLWDFVSKKASALLADS